MGKLTTLKPKVSTLKPAVATMRDTRDTAAAGNLALYRQWYKSARWQRLRAEVLTRDLYTCQQTGVLLSGKHPAPNSPVVDHIRPHRGRLELFWDPNNCQSVAKSWHDEVKQKMERSGDLD
jgi:5-methylcytosine-specific restriction endonuclease McrA